MAATLLAFHHVVIADASRTSKITVTALVVVSLVIWRSYPALIVLAILLQAGVGVYVLVYHKIHYGEGT